MVVSRDMETPIWTTKYYDPDYKDPNNVSIILRVSPYPANFKPQTLNPKPTNVEPEAIAAELICPLRPIRPLSRSGFSTLNPSPRGVHYRRTIRTPYIGLWSTECNCMLWTLNPKPQTLLAVFQVHGQTDHHIAMCAENCSDEALEANYRSCMSYSLKSIKGVI